ncbi:MAG: glycosyltransferase [Candidatus Diapherotrites archaeon]
MLTAGICAYNEGRSIGKAIASVLPQLGSNDELIVVASGCTDSTAPVVREIAEKDARVRLMEEPERRGKSSAINFILKNAKGGTIVLTDADVIVGSGAIKALEERLEESGAGAVIASTCPYKTENFFDRLQAFAWRAFNSTRAEQSQSGELFALNGYLSALRAGIVEQIPEGNLVEDWLLGWEIKKAGHAVLYEPRAEVYVQAAQNLGDYIRQKERVRTGQWQMRREGMKLSYLRKPVHLKHLLKSPYALPYLALDAAILAKAFLNFSTGRRAWEPVASSKI